LNKIVFVLILMSILLSSVAQILLKTGMSSASVLNAIADGSKPAIFRAITTSVYVLLGLFVYFSSAAVWLFVLAKIDVSTAYPFVAVGFIVTMLLAYFVNGEILSLAKVLGTVLIAIGVVVIAKG
jgi:multidrug transporter EmrE-like cation transporter